MAAWPWSEFGERRWSYQFLQRRKDSASSSIQEGRKKGSGQFDSCELWPCNLQKYSMCTHALPSEFRIPNAGSCCTFPAFYKVRECLFQKKRMNNKKDPNIIRTLFDKNFSTNISITARVCKQERLRCVASEENTESNDELWRTKVF